MDLRTPVLALCLGFAVSSAGAPSAESGQPHSHGFELWLASGPECNSCEIFAEVAKRRGYTEAVRYRRDSNEVVVPIRRIDKAALPTNILSQLSGDSGPSSRNWPIQLTVLVVRDGTVLAFGNIADSMDLRSAKIAEARMKPPANPPPNHPAFSETTDYRSYFLDHWNLEHFIGVALGDKARAAEFVDLDTSPTPPLGKMNVILWGSGGMPIKNGLFISERMQEVRGMLEHELAAKSPSFITLYGRGPLGDSNDTSMSRNGVVSFFHPELPIDYAADLAGINTVFSALKGVQGEHSLLIHVGHSGPTGIPVWGMLGTFAPEDLSRIAPPKQSHLVMVSGGCHSGLFARAVQCGFFAAHPAIVSTGCQLSPEAIERSDDYLRLFFSRISQHRATPGNVSLAQAHWDASVRLEQHQISYTTVDALADEHFTKEPSALPRHLTVGDIRKLRSAATAPEAQALDALTKGLNPGQAISLTDLVERNHAAEKQLQGMTEESSERRNEVLALPYRLMLPALARRLMYRSTHGTDTALLNATACEARSLAEL